MNKKAITIVDNAIKKATNERDRKGYRENLGYDQYNSVKSKVEKLDLGYSETCDVMAYFHRKCDSI